MTSHIETLRAAAAARDENAARDAIRQIVGTAWRQVLTDPTPAAKRSYHCGLWGVLDSFVTLTDPTRWETAVVDMDALCFDIEGICAGLTAYCTTTQAPLEE